MNTKFKIVALLTGLCSCLAAGPLYRDYNKPLTQSDSQDIKYIINNLSNSSLINIMLNRSSIERAGDRIDSVHPMQFLLHVFTNPELIAYIHNIKERSLIWKDFYQGLANSLQTESSEDNLDQYIPDFALKLKINAAPLVQAAGEKNWDKFLGVLFTSIARHPDRNRYED